MTDEHNQAPVSLPPGQSESQEPTTAQTSESLSKRAAREVLELFLQKPLYAKIEGDELYMEQVEK